MLFYKDIAMSKFQIFALLVVSAWSISMWVGYFDKKHMPEIITSEHDNYTTPVATKADRRGLSKEFIVWEAKGRLSLINEILDNSIITAARNNWILHTDILNVAKIITELQVKSYGFDDSFRPADIRVIQLRGDANGVYIPTDATIFLNDKMNWNNLPFERFVEVVLHENMHHIMTYAITYFDVDHPLRHDFELLAQAAFHHDHNGMANDRVEPFNSNLQELIAYKTQRAARYAGIYDADLTAWEMSKRTQEIRVIKRLAEF